MIKGQGGNPDWTDDVSLFPAAKYSREVRCDKDGYVYSVNAEKYGVAALVLGAGRSKKEDAIDYSAGILIAKKRGDKVQKGDVIATLYSSSPENLDEAEKIISENTVISDEKPHVPPLVLAVAE